LKPETFQRAVAVLKEAETIKKKFGGKPSTLSTEDKLLMTLEYLREYQTYFHIGQSYGVSESAYFRNVRFVEDTLVKHPDF
jgi:hypothetical protein